VLTGALRPLTARQLAAGQAPAQALPDARQRIREMNARAGRRIVVLDDDPTGSQVRYAPRCRFSPMPSM
jgi:hypothetical protein